MTEILDKINKSSSVFYCQHILDSINNLSELYNFTASNGNGTGVIKYLRYKDGNSRLLVSEMKVLIFTDIRIY